MKQYMIDQLREGDFEKLQDYLNSNAEPADLPGIYWIPMPELLYEKMQQEHTECHPFYFAVNLDRQAVSFELLIRTRNRLHCTCIQYANQNQRDYILDFADGLFETLKLVS